jgi:hypothetical protein
MPLVCSYGYTRTHPDRKDAIRTLIGPVQNPRNVQPPFAIAGNIVPDADISEQLLAAVTHEDARIADEALDEDDCPSGHEACE